MDEFYIWFSTGFTHILDWDGYDHVLYVMALCVTFPYKDWKKLVMLITAFTIGHSLTLAASVFDVIELNQVLIETFIPITIMMTCVLNVGRIYTNHVTLKSLQYGLALCFGFVHGMGFSYLLKSLLGRQESLSLPLIFFNLGLEIGQLVIVSGMLLVSVFLFTFTRFKNKYWVLIISLFVFLVALFIFIQRLISFYHEF
jgi:hypothetical protein